MKQGLLTTLVSVALSALVAVGIVKAATPTAKAGDKEIKTYTVDGSEYRTVNLSETDYPDFTYAAESSVDAVVFVKVTIRQKSVPIDDPFLRYFFGDQFGGGEQQGQNQEEGCDFLHNLRLLFLASYGKLCNDYNHTKLQMQAPFVNCVQNQC